MSLITATTSPAEKIAVRKSHATDFWLLGLRILIAVPMYYYQGWRQAPDAWGFVWEQKEWVVADEIAALNFPQPAMVSVALVFLLLAAPFGILIGFITRINALVLLLTLGFVLVAQLDGTLSPSLNPQSLLLYMGLALILSLAGGGRFSLDALMTRRRREKKKMQTF